MILDTRWTSYMLIPPRVTRYLLGIAHQATAVVSKQIVESS